jgi:hypothetical protein
MAARLSHPLRLSGLEHIPAHGPYLLTINHYSHPGFQSWWIAASVSSIFPSEISWIMTGAFQYPGQWKDRILRPLSRRVLTRLARVYGFFSMPPMPPDLRDVTARALAVRSILETACRDRGLILGSGYAPHRHPASPRFARPFHLAEHWSRESSQTNLLLDLHPCQQP